ncbi:MAG: hypothetical protein ACI94Y_004036 [Maribacter sp.]|jgi:hypothetical protein
MKQIILFIFIFCPVVLFCQVDLVGEWEMENNPSMVFQFKDTDSLDIISYSTKNKINNKRSFGVIRRDSSVLLHDKDVVFDTITVIKSTGSLLKLYSSQSKGNFNLVSVDFLARKEFVRKILAEEIMELKIIENEKIISNQLLYSFSDDMIDIFDPEKECFTVYHWGLKYSVDLESCILKIVAYDSDDNMSFVIKEMNNDEIHGKTADLSKTFILSKYEQDKSELLEVKKKLKGTWVMLKSKEEVIQKQGELHFKIYVGHPMLTISDDLKIHYSNKTVFEEEDLYIKEVCTKDGTIFMRWYDGNDYNHHTKTDLLIFTEDIQEEYMILKMCNSSLGEERLFLRKIK